jgi:hypothetical protein
MTDPEVELRAVQAEIDALYWAFTRQARAKPPAVLRPDLYARRAELEQLLGGRQRVLFPGAKPKPLPPSDTLRDALTRGSKRPKRPPKI